MNDAINTISLSNEMMETLREACEIALEASQSTGNMRRFQEAETMMAEMVELNA